MKAMKLGLKSVVVINKIDRHDARPREVLDEVYSLYIDLGADEKQLEFPVIYAIAREGKATTSLDVPGTTLDPLLDAILTHIPPPAEGPEKVLQMLVGNLDYDDYVGRLAVGRLTSGTIAVGQELAVIRAGGVQEKGKVVKLYTFDGLKRVEAKEAGVGEIISVAGIEDVSLGDTFTDIENPKPLERITVEQPTMSMIFKVNDGPFAGREGKYVTSRNIRDRLQREAYRNVAIRVEDTDSPDSFKVVGRGELQLAVIVETMRREGFELTVSNPIPLTKEIDGKTHEPMELLFCDVPDFAVGTVTERLGPRKGRMTDQQSLGSGRTRLQFRIPARGLLGFRNEFLTATRGQGIMSSQFDGYEPWLGGIPKRTNGAMIADRTGEAIPYAMFKLQDRGAFFVSPNCEVYQGMILGEHSHPNDIDVNVCREKKLTNIRSAGRDENIMLTPPREMGLEKALEWIANDELVEVTPKNVRLRKKSLSVTDRYRMDREKKRDLGLLD
jgi:GTP-binding protein